MLNEVLHYAYPISSMAAIFQDGLIKLATKLRCYVTILRKFGEIDNMVS